MTKWQGMAIAVVLCSASPAAAGPVYNNAADFSTASNPNGVWTYGFLAAGATPNGGTFSPFAKHGNILGIDYVGNNKLPLPPEVTHNTTNATNTVGTTKYAAGQAAFLPGAGGLYTVYRFTAPSTATYSLTAAFAGLDFAGPTKADVFVLDNGSVLFKGSVNGFGAGPTFSKTWNLAKGETVDFVVGAASGSSFLFDTTGLNATITPVAAPEPAGWTLLAAGALCGLAVVGLRRRRAAAARIFAD